MMSGNGIWAGASVNGGADPGRARNCKRGNSFGVRLKASAPSLHFIRADIQTEVSPIVGTERQSEELVRYLLQEFESDPSMLWETNIFGKSLHELVKEGLANKL